MSLMEDKASASSEKIPGDAGESEKKGKSLSRREFLGAVIVLAGGALACRLPAAVPTESQPFVPTQPDEQVGGGEDSVIPSEEAAGEEPPTGEPTNAQVQEATSPPEPTSAPPTPDFWAGKEIPEPMPFDELYKGSLEAVKKAQQDPRLMDMVYLKEKLLLPPEYIEASYRAIAEDENGELADPDGNKTGFGTSLMFATQSELGWGDQELVFGITQGHIFTNEESQRTANRLKLRQLHLGKADLAIPHVSWSSIDGLDASVFAFKKPQDVDIATFGLDKFAYGVTKNNLIFARGLIMPSSSEVVGYMGAYGPPDPDNNVIPPYSGWARGIHLRMPSSQGCSGSSLLNDEKKVFATIHGPYPTVSPDSVNPNKYVYDGFGTFADILPGEEKILQATLRAQMDYLGKWG